MSGSMADLEWKFVFCSKMLLQANERYRLVDRIKNRYFNIPKNEGINRRAEFLST